jgi:hypothetical protein
MGFDIGGLVSGIVNLPEEVGEAVGQAVYSVTGNQTVAQDAQLVVSKGPEGALISAASDALGLNQAQKGATEFGLGVVSGDIPTVLAGMRDFMDGRQSGDDLFASPNANANANAQAAAALPFGAEAYTGTSTTSPTYVPPVSNGGYAPPAVPTTPVDDSAPGQMDFPHALQTLKNNFDLLDTAGNGAGRDGLVGYGDLQAIVNNPGAPADLKAAAQFMLDNPAYFHALDLGSGVVNQQDGLFSMGDLDAEIAKYPVTDASSLSTYTPPIQSVGSSGYMQASGVVTTSNATGSSSNVSSTPSNSSASASSSDSDISSILNDPNMSLEDKVDAIIAAIVDTLGREILDAAADVDKNATANQKANGANGSSGTNGTSAGGASNQNSDSVISSELQQRLTSLTNARNELTQMLTNFSKDEHDTRSQIIGNMR